MSAVPPPTAFPLPERFPRILRRLRVLARQARALGLRPHTATAREFRLNDDSTSALEGGLRRPAPCADATVFPNLFPKFAFPTVAQSRTRHGQRCCRLWHDADLEPVVACIGESHRYSSNRVRQMAFVQVSRKSSPLRAVLLGRGLATRHGSRKRHERSADISAKRAPTPQSAFLPGDCACYPTTH